MYKLAQKAQVDSAAGSDGLLPAGIKYMPTSALQEMQKLIELCNGEKQKLPLITALTRHASRKKGEGSKPVEHRLG